jgi:predicted PurR-regulated permease PerM
MDGENDPRGISPRWSSNTKLIVGLTLVAIVAILLAQFHTFVGPLILSFILAYLFHPIAASLTNKLKISWRIAVAIVFIILAILLAGLFTLAGFAIVQQIQSLITAIRGFIEQIPVLLSTLTGQVHTLGPFQLDLSSLDLTSFTDRILSSIQTVLGQVGGLVGTIAASTISTLGYVIFIVIIAYFLLVEVGQVRENLLYFELPGYDQDIRRFGRELTRIWDAYLRSQLVIILLVALAYYLLMNALGMRFSLGIALMAALARLVPYLGPFIVWTVAALVAFFQPNNYFNLQPWAYALLVVGLSLLLDQVFDQYIQPRVMGTSLGIHPAAILVAAIIAFQWLGIIGLVLAAPVLATVILLVRYALRKLFDLDPWPQAEREAKVTPVNENFSNRLRTWWRRLFRQ